MIWLFVLLLAVELNAPNWLLSVWGVCCFWKIMKFICGGANNA